MGTYLIDRPNFRNFSMALNSNVWQMGESFCLYALKTYIYVKVHIPKLMPHKFFEGSKMARYKDVGGKKLIEIRVKTAAQLFDARDPSPFRERDLDDNFVEYVVSSAKEFSHKTPLQIKIHINEPQRPELNEAAIIEAYKAHADYAVHLAEQRLSEFIRRGQFALLIGLAVLFICVAASQYLTEISKVRAVRVIAEGLTIIGWVSLWRPIELLLYDWWPVYAQLRLLRKLAATNVTVIYGQ
jgi:hypothetical protein